MSTVFADTSGLYAVLDRDEANHTRAKQVWEGLLRDSVLLTNSYVLVETIALIQYRLGLAALRAFSDDILPLLRVDWVTEEAHGAALQAVFTASRKKLSLVDCMSFQTMRNHGVTTVFCFDRHFREQGFETLP